MTLPLLPDVPATPPVPERIAEMYRVHGYNVGQTCSTCYWLRHLNYTKTVYKCRRTHQSGGSATDWRLKWAACGLWETKQETL